MQKVHLLLILTLCQLSLFGQQYDFVSSERITSLIDNDGTMNFDKQESGFKVKSGTDFSTSTPTLYATGLWLGASTANQEFRFARTMYLDIGYQPGPVGYQGTFDFNQVWKVTGEEIENLKIDFSDGNIDNEPPSSILLWPAKGNSNLAADFPEGDFAPFHDELGDGIYNPYDGDYPTISAELSQITPLEMIYSIFHDDMDPTLSEPLNIDVHAIHYSLQCQDEETIDRAIFTNFRFVNRGEEAYQTFYAGIWQDFDIGCKVDDLTGCSPENNLFYGYNSDALDGDGNGDCEGSPTFGSNPAVHGCGFLNQQMSSFNQIHRIFGDLPEGMSKPETNEEYHNVFQGTWRDGTPISVSEFGYDLDATETTKYLYNGDPNDLSTWSMLSSDFLISDKTELAVSELSNLNPEESLTLDIVQFVTLDASFGHLEKVTQNEIDMQTIQQAYDNQFEDMCSFTVANKNYELLEDQFKIWPNPTRSQISIQSERTFDQLEIFDIQGKLILQKPISEKNFTINHNLVNGVYFVKLTSEKYATIPRKIIVVD